jgi:hypothetical protein
VQKLIAFSQKYIDENGNNGATAFPASAGNSFLKPSQELIKGILLKQCFLIRIP